MARKLSGVALPSASAGACDVEGALAHEVRSRGAAAEEAERLTICSGTGILHAGLFGPHEADAELAVTHCGWRFRRSGFTVKPDASRPRSYKDICARCFPAEREASKAKLHEDARRLG